MLHAYQDILGAYNKSDALKKGDLTSYPNANVLAFKRVLEQKEVLVLVNVRNSLVTYDIPVELENTAWIDTSNNSAVTLPVVIDLEPYRYIVLSKNNLFWF
jgi:alpha-amylase